MGIFEKTMFLECMQRSYKSIGITVTIAVTFKKKWYNKDIIEKEKNYES